MVWLWFTFLLQLKRFIRSAFVNFHSFASVTFDPNSKLLDLLAGHVVKNRCRCCCCCRCCVCWTYSWRLEQFTMPTMRNRARMIDDHHQTPLRIYTLVRSRIATLAWKSLGRSDEFGVWGSMPKNDMRSSHAWLSWSFANGIVKRISPRSIKSEDTCMNHCLWSKKFKVDATFIIIIGMTACFISASGWRSYVSE
jgi:hypothetical protein